MDTEDSEVRCPHCDRRTATESLWAHVGGCECLACLAACWGVGTAGCADRPYDWRGESLKLRARVAELEVQLSKLRQFERQRWASAEKAGLRVHRNATLPPAPPWTDGELRYAKRMDRHERARTERRRLDGGWLATSAPAEA